MRKDSFHLFDDESKKYSSTVRSSLRPKRSHAMAIKHNSETSSQRANLSPTKSSRKSHSNYSNGKPIEKLSQQLDKRTMTLIKQVDQFILRHTWIVPLAILCAVGSLFALNPTPSNPVYNFIFIEYRIDPETPGQSVQYGKGPRDCLFVVFYAIFMFFARDFVMLEFLQPLAQWFGLSSQAKQVRFMEQGYKSIYLAVSSSTGLYIMSKSPMWYFNMKAMCAGFPQLTLNGPFKLYFLWQWAYWVSEIVVMGLGREKPRKDYNQLVIHHWVAFSLIGISYCFHYTYMGLAAFLVHDVSDLFLAVSTCVCLLMPLFVSHTDHDASDRLPKCLAMLIHPS